MDDKTFRFLKRAAKRFLPPLAGMTSRGASQGAAAARNRCGTAAAPGRAPRK
ncbi:MAG: hypothetical protein OXU61_04640 [Gammaproteobacteria bacterium]|nr:hypothetical protein [Gammaproteobacteria bacterium]